MPVFIPVSIRASAFLGNRRLLSTATFRFLGPRAVSRSSAIKAREPCTPLCLLRVVLEVMARPVLSGKRILFKFLNCFVHLSPMPLAIIRVQTYGAALILLHAEQYVANVEQNRELFLRVSSGDFVSDLLFLTEFVREIWVEAIDISVEKVSRNDLPQC